MFKFFRFKGVTELYLLRRQGFNDDIKFWIRWSHIIDVNKYISVAFDVIEEILLLFFI